MSALLLNVNTEGTKNTEENEAKITPPTEKKSNCCHDINFGVYILVACFGMSSWISINGVFVEQPLLVASLPEGWNLPSYLAVVVQIGNVSILVTTVLHQKFSDSRHQIIVIYVMMISSTIALLCLSFFWDYTANVGGQSHSVPLIILVFILSLTSCSSSVVFLPFMANFKSQYMNAFFLGEGMSGFLPSIIALAQGVGDINCKNRSVFNNTSNETDFELAQVNEKLAFGVGENILVIAAITIISIISFSMLNFSRFCKAARAVEDTTPEKYENVKLLKTEKIRDINGYSDANEEIAKEQMCDSILQNKNISPETEESNQKEQTKVLQKISISRYIYYLILTTWIHILDYGILLTVQTYSTLPYGRQTYHLAVVISNMVDPVACFLAEFIMAKSTLVIGSLTCLGTLISGYIVFLAKWSPDPIPIGITTGAVLSVIAWTAAIFILTFSKVCIAAIIREEGKKALLWCGVTKQIGASSGAVVMYILINVFQLFESTSQC